MKINVALLLVFGAASACAWSQGPGAAPAELQPGYPGYPALNAPSFPAPEAPRQDIPGVSDPSSRAISPGLDSHGASPAPPQSGGVDSGPSGVEVRPLSPTPIKPLSPPAPMTRFEPVTENGVRYLCGGVGLDESDQMKSEARNYDILLTFAAQNGNYLADVNVDIADGRGASLLRASCGGPMMLVDLPRSGSYRIRAETGGHTVTRAVKIKEGQRGHAVNMMWPSSATETSRPGS